MAPAAELPEYLRPYAAGIKVGDGTGLRLLTPRPLVTLRKEFEGTQHAAITKTAQLRAESMAQTAQEAMTDYQAKRAQHPVLSWIDALRREGPRLPHNKPWNYSRELIATGLAKLLLPRHRHTLLHMRDLGKTYVKALTESARAKDLKQIPSAATNSDETGRLGWLAADGKLLAVPFEEQRAIRLFALKEWTIRNYNIIPTASEVALVTAMAMDAEEMGQPLDEAALEKIRFGLLAPDEALEVERRDRGAER